MDKILDIDAIEDMRVRWKLAERHLLGTSENPEAGELALHAVISHDVPILLDRLRRLEPALAI